MKWYYAAAALAAADRATKLLASACLRPGAHVTLVPGALTLVLTRNPGAAFGLLPDRTFLFVAGAVVVFAFLLPLGRRLPDPRAQLGLGLLLGGTAGNLIDRLFFGRVVDFVDLGILPVFNLADVGIVAGGLLLAARLAGAREGAIGSAAVGRRLRGRRR